ncbi:MAG TPA: hypothetical protein VLT33_04565 [Labilithrix sp.]|nr:hypothetical protein [Labilithrix sp.]
MSGTTFALPPLASIKPSPASRTLGALRSQAAFLRSLLDEVERLAPASGSENAMGDQLVEELTRLGCLSLEAASQLTHVIGASKPSPGGGDEHAASAGPCKPCVFPSRREEACPRLRLLSDAPATSTVRLVLAGGTWRDPR